MQRERRKPTRTSTSVKTGISSAATLMKMNDALQRKASARSRTQPRPSSRGAAVIIRTA